MHLVNFVKIITGLFASGIVCANQQYISIGSGPKHVGSCGIDVDFSGQDQAIVALKYNLTFDGQYMSAQCNRCVRVLGGDLEFVARVVSSCDQGCDEKTIQMSSYHALQLGNVDNEMGRIPVRWWFVNCETNATEPIFLNSTEPGTGYEDLMTIPDEVNEVIDDPSNDGEYMNVTASVDCQGSDPSCSPDPTVDVDPISTPSHSLVVNPAEGEGDDVKVAESEGRCGKGFGSRCPGNECCSQFGYCGTTTNFCNSLCQSDFGNCNITKAELPLDELNEVIDDPSNDGENMDATASVDCQGSNALDLACSSDQSVNLDPATTPSHSSVVNPAEVGGDNLKVAESQGRCGKEFGSRCPGNECCSRYGYCGTSKYFCNTMCQSDFGNCDITKAELTISDELYEVVDNPSNNGGDYTNVTAV